MSRQSSLTNIPHGLGFGQGTEQERRARLVRKLLDHDAHGLPQRMERYQRTLGGLYPERGHPRGALAVRELPDNPPPLHDLRAEAHEKRQVILAEYRSMRAGRKRIVHAWLEKHTPRLVQIEPREIAAALPSVPPHTVARFASAWLAAHDWRRVGNHARSIWARPTPSPAGPHLGLTAAPATRHATCAPSRPGKPGGKIAHRRGRHDVLRGLQRFCGRLGVIHPELTIRVERG